MRISPRALVALSVPWLLGPPLLAAVPGTPGSAGVPALSTSPPLLGTLLGIDLADALPGAPVVLLFSTTDGPTPTAYGTLGLGAPSLLVLATGVADAGGAYSLALPLPHGDGFYGFPLNLQAGVQDAGNPTGFALSNSVNTWIFTADVDVDADRDGSVDPAGAGDELDEDAWGPSKGAVVLCNADDDDDDGLEDHGDAVVNGAADALDLAPLRVRAAPGIPADWTGELVVDAGAAPWVRLFRDDGAGGFVVFDPATSNPIDAAELAAGVDLAVEARDFAQTAVGAPGAWGGEALVSLVLRDALGAERARDEVRLRVAPFVLHSNLSPGEVLLVTKKSSTLPFIGALRQPAMLAGATLETIDAIAHPAYGIWVQDAMEFGWSAAPAPGGARVMPSVLRSPRGKPLDAWTHDTCLAPDFGYVYKGWTRTGVGWIDWFGNLDCTPPLPGWPLGRVYTGRQGAITLHPAVLEFLEAQRVQAPVLQIDTDWLLIGHVDEEICFVPSEVGSPYRMLVPSTTMALQILSDLRDAGQGQLPVFEGKGDQTTVGAILGNAALVTYNEGLQPVIDAVREQMKSALGVAEADVIDVPALFSKSTGGRAIAYVPNMVNALVLGQRVIASDPFGPVDGGVDRFKQPLVEALAPLGLTVDFVDDWSPYHVGLGEVHCGTNAIRSASEVPWWSVP